MSSGWAAFPGGKQPDENIGPSLVGFVWAFTGISGVVLALRLFVVCRVLRCVRAADYTMVAAFLFVLASGVMVTKAVEWGIGRHIYYLSPEQISNTLKYSIFLVGPSLLSCVLARASFCLFLLNTIGAQRIVRILLWAALALQAIFNVSQVIMQYASCGKHITALWDPSVKAKCIPYRQVIRYLTFLSALNAFIDLFLTILPAVLLKNLRLEFRKKVIVITLLSLSALAFIASLVKCFMIREMKNRDATWSIARLDYWVMGECYVIIIVASMPLMSSFVKWGKKTITSRGYGSASRSQNQVTVKQSWSVKYEPSDNVKLSKSASEEASEQIV